MNDKPTVIVIGDQREDETVKIAAATGDGDVVTEGGISRRVPRSASLATAVGLLSAMGVRRRDVVRRNRAARLEANPIVPGGGARERARRLRQMSRQGA